MITYVNTVLVSNAASATVETEVPAAANAASKKGCFVIMNADSGAIVAPANIGGVKRIKVGIITGKTVKDHKGVDHTDVKWSNIINKVDVRAISKLVAPENVNTEDTVEIDIKDLDPYVTESFAQGGKRFIVRLTFKDLPNRYRKWTESYEYITPTGDVSDSSKMLAYKQTVVSGIAELINKQWKRARVVATATTTSSNAKVTLVAMPYDDDNSVETLNWANKVRFNANIYYTDPAAEGWESLNKHFPLGATIEKTPGFRYAADAKLVRDRESQAMGYLGIINRGEGTWPIIKPEMETDLTKKYDALTLEFENMYRAADDIFRKNKQTLEVYIAHANSQPLFTALTTFAQNAQIVDEQTEDGIND